MLPSWAYFDPANWLDRKRAMERAEQRNKERKEKGWSKARQIAERAINVKEKR